MQSVEVSASGTAVIGTAPVNTAPMNTVQQHEVVELVGTGRAVSPQQWVDGPAPETGPLQCRGGDVDWVCGDCGAAVLVGIRRPETLRTVELRCPVCRRYQRRNA